MALSYSPSTRRGARRASTVQDLDRYADERLERFTRKYAALDVEHLAARLPPRGVGDDAHARARAEADVEKY